MTKHPGGKEQTMAMLYLAKLPEGSRVLDMGAGEGENLPIFKNMGFEGHGIDLNPRGEGVEKGDFLNCPYPDGYFDGIISQCSFYLSGDIDKAIAEAGRLLKKGGKLMLADVCFENWEAQLEKAGLKVLNTEDITAIWQAYYLERLWRGEDVPESPGGKCRYLVLVCEKVK